jgi:hypothetical protein
MQGYTKGCKGRFITVHYNGYVEASMQGYSKGRNGPFILLIMMAEKRPL